MEDEPPVEETILPPEPEPEIIEEPIPEEMTEEEKQLVDKMNQVLDDVLIED